MNIGIIGAGIGGMAAAVRLAASGHEVTLWERNGVPGGKLAEMRMDGCRFDAGPSLVTLPALLEELFELCGERMAERLPMLKLTNACRYHFVDGSAFTFYDDPARRASELAAAGIGEEAAIRRRLNAAREAYELGAPVFLFNDFHRWSNFRTPPFRRVAARLGRLDMLRTMHGANRRDFDDPRIVALFDRYATYNGSDPYRAPATLNMIAHLEHNLGAWFPAKGMYAIAEALYALALRQGVRFRFSSPVGRIEVRDGCVAGLRVGGERHPYDAVVSDVDVRYLAAELLERHPLRRRLGRAEPSTSALIFFWRMERTFPSLELHNIFFAGDYRAEFRHLFRLRDIADDPTVYLFISAKAVAGDAPEGCENWYVMVNAPADSGQEWERIVARTRRNIVRKLEAALGLPVERSIAAERILTPRDIGERTMSVGGALYGAASNSPLAAFLRHPNSLRTPRGLYFAGGSVHPGGGIPLCLAGAKIAADAIGAAR